MLHHVTNVHVYILHLLKHFEQFLYYTFLMKYAMSEQHLQLLQYLQLIHSASLNT